MCNTEKQEVPQEIHPNFPFQPIPLKNDFLYHIPTIRPTCEYKNLYETWEGMEGERVRGEKVG